MQGYKLEKSPSMMFIYDYHAFYQISKCTGENSMTLLSSETLTMVQQKKTKKKQVLSLAIDSE